MVALLKEKMKEFNFFGHIMVDHRDECPDCGEPIDNIGIFGSICNNCGGQKDPNKEDQSNNKKTQKIEEWDGF